MGLNWQKYIFIKGKLGIGKSYVVKVVIEECLEDDYIICCVTFIGILIFIYYYQFVEEIFCCDIIYVMFTYLVVKEEKVFINWELGKFDVLIISSSNLQKLYKVRRLNRQKEY